MSAQGYGPRHHSHCRRNMHEPCTCGLDKLRAENADLRKRIRLARKAMSTPVSPDNENPVHTIMRALDLRKPLPRGRR